MKNKICVLNLTRDARFPARRLSVSRLPLGPKMQQETIEDPKEIPDHVEPLILYIVGHAVPNAVRLPGGQMLSEKKLVKTVINRRAAKKTLIIWDFCYAASFRDIGRRAWAQEPYVHIFSCKPYEQSWQTGGKIKPARCTLFSLALREATKKRVQSWPDLRRDLQARLGHVQHPAIGGRQKLTPANFGL